MIVTTPHGHPIKCGVSRNMLAEDEDGNEVRLALVIIEHENGFKQSLAIPESKIAFMGEGIIAQEVIEAAAKGGLLHGSPETRRN